MYNLHTHTKRCMHAIGEDEEYVKSAISNGYTLLGFADHVPYIYPKNYISHMRMTIKDADDYINSINSLKQKYSDKIEILQGYEMEYYPQLFNSTLTAIKEKGYDYLILAQHFLNNEYEEPGFIYVGHITTNKKILDKYIDQLLQGAKTGEFLYVAHPDLVYFVGDEKYYIDKMEYMLKELKKLNMPIEFNILGYTEKRQYPCKTFWDIAKNIKNDVIIGIDAHNPKAFNNLEVIEQATNYIESLDMHILTQNEIKERIKYVKTKKG